MARWLALEPVCGEMNGLWVTSGSHTLARPMWRPASPLYLLVSPLSRPLSHPTPAQRPIAAQSDTVLNFIVI